MREGYIKLNDLFVYKIAIELCNFAWGVYEVLDWKDKKIIGDQYIRSTDSIAANIAEGYGRYHYLDKIKFYYNARASHYEAVAHWLSLLLERNFINKEQYQSVLIISSELAPKLNKYISSTYNAKQNQITNF